MKEAINITIGGVAFTLEQDAYRKLKSYLQEIQDHFSGNEDCAEILDDIERGIAEKLVRRKEKTNQAVTLTDITEVIDEIGSVSEFADEPIGQAKRSAPADDIRRRFYRSEDDVVIAGVASGIASYFDIEPVFTRLVFVLTAFLNGLGIFAYLLLWLIVPVARTTEEKYAMKGRRVTLAEINERVRSGVERVRETDMTPLSRVGDGFLRVSGRFFSFLGHIVRFLGSLIRITVGVAIVVLAVVGLTFFFVALSFLTFDISSLPIDPLAIQLYETVTAGVSGFVFVFGMVLLAAIPLVILFMAGISLLGRKSVFTLGKSVTLIALWCASIVIVTTGTVFSYEQLDSQIEEYRQNRQTSVGEWREYTLDGSPEAVSLAGNGSIRLIESDEVSLRIFAAPLIHNDLTIDSGNEVHSGQVLSIEYDPPYMFCIVSCDQFPPFVVELRAPDIESLSARGRGDIIVETDRDTFSLDAYGAYDIFADLTVREFSVYLSGETDLVTMGEADYAVYELHGSHQVSTFAMPTGEVEVHGYGSHTIDLAPLSSLQVELRGDSTLRYLAGDIDLDEDAEFSSIEEISTDEAADALVAQQRRIERLKASFERLETEE